MIFNYFVISPDIILSFICKFLISIYQNLKNTIRVSGTSVVQCNVEKVSGKTNIALLETIRTVMRNRKMGYCFSSPP